MRYRLMGQSGLRVSDICLGTMTFGDGQGWGTDAEESMALVDRFFEAGGNFVDTANKYTSGESEKIVGRALRGRRQRAVLATKYSLNTDPTDPNAGGNHRKSLIHAVEASLQRLETDHIDLLWIHAWDGMSPIRGVMRALDDLVRAGKVGAIGASDTPAWLVSYANAMADAYGWTPFSALQLQYSLVERTSERELIPMANALGLGVTAWSPLAGGLLTGKYSGLKADVEVPDSKRASVNGWRRTERNLTIAAAVDRAAADLGWPPAQVAVAWVLQRGALPIVGARTPAQLEDHLSAAARELPLEVLETLDAASAIRLGFPHDFLAWKPIVKAMFGQTRALIDA
mgnify:CR=1 FL=1